MKSCSSSTRSMRNWEVFYYFPFPLFVPFVSEKSRHSSMFTGRKCLHRSETLCLSPVCAPSLSTWVKLWSSAIWQGQFPAEIGGVAVLLMKMMTMMIMMKALCKKLWGSPAWKRLFVHSQTNLADKRRERLHLQHTVVWSVTPLELHISVF